MPDDNTLPAPVKITTASPKPVEPVKTELPAETISDADADAAAKSLGMTFFSAAKSRKLKILGQFQAQHGVVNLGVGRLAAADEALQRMIETAVVISEDDEQPTNDRVGALVAGRGLVEALQKSIQMMADFQQEKLIGPAVQKKRTFVDEQPVVPIQAQSGATVTVNVVDSSAAARQSK